MTPLEQHYEHLIDPVNWVKNFPDMQGFKIWCEKGCISDLRDMRKVYERKELYEHCRAIQQVIDVKVDKMLEGFGFEID